MAMYIKQEEVEKKEENHVEEEEKEKEKENGEIGNRGEGGKQAKVVEKEE